VFSPVKILTKRKIESINSVMKKMKKELKASSRIIFLLRRRKRASTRTHTKNSLFVKTLNKDNLKIRPQKDLKRCPNL
jgi:hypothetical protein